MQGKRIRELNKTVKQLNRQIIVYERKLDKLEKAMEPDHDGIDEDYRRDFRFVAAEILSVEAAETKALHLEVHEGLNAL